MRSVPRPALLAAAMLAWSIPVQATAPARPPADERPADCTRAATQRQLNACAYADFEVAQAGYAAVMRDLSARLDSAQRTLLQGAQTAWLQYRTAACQFEASGARGGSAETMLRMQCQARMTRERTAALRRQLDCPEGDLGCVRPATPPVRP